MRILRRAASLLLHGRAYDAARTNHTTRLQGSFLRVPSGELKLLRPGNTMEVLVEKQRYTTNTVGEPSAFKYLTGEEEATMNMKTSDGDERMEGSKKLTDDKEHTLKVRFQEWMNKLNRNYKDDTEKACRFEIFKSTVERVEKFNAEQVKKYGYCKWIQGTNKFADLTREEALNKFGRGKRSRQSLASP